MNTKLSIEHVYKIFGPHPRRALERLRNGEGKDDIFAATGMTVGVSDASFEVAEGEVFVVMGLSGSGKSTLVRMLNRLIEPTAGAVRIDGRDIMQMSRKQLIDLRRHEISMVFQSFALMPHQTVLENTAFGLNVAGLSASEREQRALDALDAVGLKANAKSYPDELSGGMKQRVGLARALAVNPGILLMDEAFSALDPLIRTEMQDELMRLQAEQARTVVFITHDLDEAMRVGDRIAIMQAGEVVQIGTPEEIVRAPANAYVESFFRDVDISQVFTAADVARTAEVTAVEQADTGLRAALSRLKVHDSDIAVVVDAACCYQGTVSIQSLQSALDELPGSQDGDLATAFVAGVAPVADDTPLNDLMGSVADSAYPIPVVDSEQRYAGSITSATLLHTLNRTEASAA